MTLNQWVRQIHRWLSIAFVVSVIVYIIVMTRGPVPAWLNVFPAGSLILMLVTGLYLFALPHVTGRRVLHREGGGAVTK